MKNRIWSRIKRTGTAVVVAAVVLAGSGTVRNAKAQEAETLWVSGSEEMSTGEELIWEGEVLDPANEQADGKDETSEEDVADSEEIENEIGEGEDTNSAGAGEGQEEGNSEEEETAGENPPTGSHGEENSEGTETGEGQSEVNPDEPLDAEGSSDSQEEDKPEEESPKDPLEMSPEELVFMAEADSETARAGETLLYTVSTENTGEGVFEDVFLQADFGEALSGSWENQKGEPLAEGEKISVGPGEKKVFYLYLSLPEDRENAVELKLSLSAKMQGTAETFTKTQTVSTDITPLRADFEVTKTPDRIRAVPGDRILFQICIRNTGERTLHSILTTEKFQMENVPVIFLEKEGVSLNNTKTKALISSLEPGRSFSLQAAVTLPEDIKSGELINMVEVVTKETKDRTVTSQAGVQILSVSPTEEPQSMEQPADREDYSPVSKARPVSSNPKTGDTSEAGVWAVICLGGLLAAGFLLRKHSYGSSRFQ